MSLPCTSANEALVMSLACTLLTHNRFCLFSRRPGTRIDARRPVWRCVHARQRTQPAGRVSLATLAADTAAAVAGEEPEHGHEAHDDRQGPAVGQQVRLTLR